MKMLARGAVAILIILGLAKTIQDYDVINELDQHLSENNISNTINQFNNFKNLHESKFNPSDFF